MAGCGAVGLRQDGRQEGRQEGRQDGEPNAQGMMHASLPVPAWKRWLDLGLIGLSLPLVVPLLVLLALWVKRFSAGPALLRQTRIGRDGQPFVLFKLRTMRQGCGHRRHEAYMRHLAKSERRMVKLDLLCDGRIIPGGWLLRAAGLDELPQLWNVVRGEMSLVGPRPCLPTEFALFSPVQRERFRVLPGLTGSWQVSGKNRSSFGEMNRMDAHYVRHASLAMDWHILLRTPAALIDQLALTYRHHQHAAHRRDAALGSPRGKPGCPAPYVARNA